MPVSGGASDKLGNRYEALWAIDQILQIVDGSALRLTLEPLDPDESRGIEFKVAKADGTTEYWSVKRQTTKAAGWTIALLASKDDHGRTILGDLLEHVKQNATHRSVFASTLGASTLTELCEYAVNPEILKQRLAKSVDLEAAFSKHVLLLCHDDKEQAVDFLQRVRTHAIDKAQLRDRVGFAIRKLFYAEDGRILDVDAVRLHLGDLLLDNIHQALDRKVVLSILGEHGFRLREWVIDEGVRDRVEEICEGYSEPVRSAMINDKFIPLNGVDSILKANGRPIAKKVLVVGGAGGGKSTTLVDVVEQMRRSGGPVLVVRFDQFPEGILSTRELGRKLFLPESPVLVLAGVANGAASVLVVDQLDAVSLASGRRTELWSLFEELSREAERFPNMSLIVGCREFDLKHDHRMRKMTTESAGYVRVKLRPFSIEQVDAALKDAAVDPAIVQPALKKNVLTLPLHLSMFLKLSHEDRTHVHNSDELFDSFWTEGERRTSKRLGRKAEWTKVIDQLANWLSENQLLSAPTYVLDDFSDDATSMASEHVIILSDDKYRFFHDSFFDYAFARRFACKGGRLVDLLLGDEQHLFRRAQVRQVLAFLRAKDLRRYLNELEIILTTDGVRFHIKAFVFQWLSSLPDPLQEEWVVLQGVFHASDRLWNHIRGVITGPPGWFDVLDKARFFDEALASGDAARESEAVSMLGYYHTLVARSARVAELFRKYRKPGEKWKQYLHSACRTGQIFHSREMFDLFLLLIDDGTLDDFRRGPSDQDDWWGVLHSTADKRPDLACEAIGHWFDRTISRWHSDASARESLNGEMSLRQGLIAHLDRGSYGFKVINNAARSPQHYAKHLLPRIANLVNETARDRQDELQTDALWCYRVYGDRGHRIHDTLFIELAKSLETLATTAPADLDRLLEPYQDRPQNAIAYLVLRSWTAAPDIYADRLAEYLAADPRRLKIGYEVYDVSGGSAKIHVSSQAVKAASTRCSTERFSALEEAIVLLKDVWEARHPQIRGRKQLELLMSLDSSRLSEVGRAKLGALQRKFPQMEHQPPMAMEMKLVGSPIPENAQERMSDKQWLRAMRKYSGVDLSTRDPGDLLSGGKHQLTWSLEAGTKSDPVRFTALAERMPDDLPASYFDAILRGVASCLPSEKDSGSTNIALEQTVAFIRRVHALPTRPCGRWIAWLIKQWKGYDWPEELIEIVAWYAANDPDPAEEIWRVPALRGQPYDGGTLVTTGINSTRGAIAGAVARLLFDRPERFNSLHDTVYYLAHDRSAAVRSCAIEVLLAVLNADVLKSISWFRDCVMDDPVILETPLVGDFIHYAGYRDYAALHPIIELMLKSTADKVVEVAARQVCLFALTLEAAEKDAAQIREGSPAMRKAAADVYSTNVAHEAVGAACRKLVKPFFADPDDSVREAAASTFQQIGNLGTPDQADLLAAVIDTFPGRAVLGTVLRALEQSHVQLPDLVCRLAEICMEPDRDKAGDISLAYSGIAIDLTKIVVRLYAQTEDTSIKSRCLNLIDQMEMHHFLGLSEELQRLDR